MGLGRRGVRILEDGREQRLPGLLYADDSVLCGESKKDLRVIAGRFAEVCRRRGMKVSAGKSKVLVLNGMERLEYQVHVDGIRLEHVSEFKYLGCVLNESGTDGQSVLGSWRVGGGFAGAIRSLVNAGICSLSVPKSYVKHCLYQFLCMAVRQCYGRRRNILIIHQKLDTYMTEMNNFTYEIKAYFYSSQG